MIGGCARRRMLRDRTDLTPEQEKGLREVIDKSLLTSGMSLHVPLPPPLEHRLAAAIGTDRAPLGQSANSAGELAEQAEQGQIRELGVRAASPDEFPRPRTALAAGMGADDGQGVKRDSSTGSIALDK